MTGRTVGSSGPRGIGALRQSATLMFVAGKFDAAEAEIHPALELARGTLGETDWVTLECRACLGRDLTET